MGLEKTGIKYQFLKERKTSYFLFYRRSSKKAFLELRLILQPEKSVCAQGALDWKRDYIWEWVMQGECP